MFVRTLFRFPNPVNEVSARLVAAGVVLMAVVAVGFHQMWLLVPLTYGFLARVFTGPTLSPLGQVVTRVLTPRLPFAEKTVPGPPKRFAQGMGATFTVSASILHFGFGYTGAAEVLLGMLIVAALLESALGLCLGCKVFALLMRVGIIPEEVCESCSNIWARPSMAGQQA